MVRTVTDWGTNVAALALVIAVNAVANTVAINGQTTGQVSAKYPSLFTPAGFTFSIWSLIYVGLLAFVVYQALPAQRTSATLARIGPWFRLGCAANIGWILAWHYDFLLLSLAVMTLLLVTLLRIDRIIEHSAAPDRGLRLLALRIPFSLYLGWISVAIVANFSAVQTGLGWDDVGTTAINWTLLKLAVLGAVAAVVALRRRDIAFVLVVAWAAFGIASGQAPTPAVAGAARMLVFVALLLALVAAIEQRPKRAS